MIGGVGGALNIVCGVEEKDDEFAGIRARWEQALIPTLNPVSA